MVFSQGKKLFYVGLVLIAVVGLPVIIYLSQKPQETRSRAAPSTSLYMTPASTASTPITKYVNDTVALDIYVEPGKNLPSLVKLDLQYDPSVLQPAAVPFTVNYDAFPKIVEGPVVSNGHVLIVLSIGSDSTKAIQATTKVGTVNFKATYATSTPSTVSFGSKTQVLSLAQTDDAEENVLSTTTPAYLSILNYAYPTPTSYYPPTPASYYPPTPTQIAYYPTPTTPYYLPTPTTGYYPTAPSGSTKFYLDVIVHGIGAGGDNANPTGNSLSNKDPLHPTQYTSVKLYDQYDQLFATAVGDVTYNKETGSYKGTLSTDKAVTAGQYNIRVTVDKRLTRLVPGIQNITGYEPTVNLPTLTVVTGDTTRDNSLNILDYNMLLDCYSDFEVPAMCEDPKKKVDTDLNDDGNVSHIDYNLFLRELSTQMGA